MVGEGDASCSPGAKGFLYGKAESNPRDRSFAVCCCSGSSHPRWVPREDAPGIVLLKGDRDADWTLCNATDKSSLAILGRSQVHLTADCCTYQQAQRIPTGRPLSSTRVGEKVLVLRNAGWFLFQVAEVGKRRFRVRDHYGIFDGWIAADRVRRPER